ncbi:MAG TPA: translocation/assembly module TamB domain-containing protein, partial [Kofleriaceae bacterium]|nr:translocation/assembly module TamB domain-containing protein [Kofleriaceae bacterium]
ELPGDIIVAAKATEGAYDLIGTIGAMTVRGAARGDVKTRAASGVVAATGLDLVPFGGRGRGDVTAAFVVTDKTSLDVRGMVKVIGEVDHIPASELMVAGNLVGDKGSVFAIGRGAGHAAMAVSASLARKGSALSLAQSSVVASVDDPVAASGGLAPVKGTATVRFNASGTLTPIVHLQVTNGTVSGKRLAFDDYTVASLDGRFEAKHIPSEIAAIGDVTLDGVAQAGKLLGKVSVRGANRVDGTIDITATARPAMAQLTAQVDAAITHGVDAITIALNRHTITGDNGVVWSGRGGKVVIDNKAIAITGIRSENAGGAITASANVDRATKILTASVGATSIPMSLVDLTYRGVVAGTAKLVRNGRSITGTATLDGTGIAVIPDAPPVDTSLTIDIGRKVEIHARATNPDLGTAKLASTIKPPADLTDVVAWQHLQRTAIESAELTLEHVDAKVVATRFANNDRVSGIIDSQLAIAGLDTHGSIAVTGVAAGRAGSVDATVTITPGSDGDVHAATKLTIAGIGEGTVDTELGLPDHLFDPAAWQALGNNALRSAAVRVAELVIDDAKLAKLGIDTPYRGRVAAKVDIAAGLSRIDVALDGTDIHGGTLAKPIELHATTTLDHAGTTGQLVVRAAHTDLVTARASLPVTTDRMLAIGKDELLVTPLSGTIMFGSDAVPSVSVPEMLAVIGRTEATAGRLDGEIAISGTVGTPIADAPALTVRDLAVVARVPDRPPPRLEHLSINAHWGGSSGRIEASGTESNGGTLTIKASGRPDLPSTFIGSLGIEKFDLSPLAVLLPTRLLGAAGILKANVDVHGDPRTTPITGTIHLGDGRLPIAATVGTLRSATVDITLEPKDIKIVADGKIGAGTIHIDGTATGDGTQLVDHATAKVKLRKFSPIGSIEPMIDGDLDVVLNKIGSVWNGSATVSHASVTVTPKSGDKLLAISVPSDLHLDGTAAKPTAISFGNHHAVDRPFLLFEIDINPNDPINVRAQIDPAEFRGTLSSRRLVVSIGDDIGMNGDIVVERGDLDLFGHRYQVDHARTTFVDSIDPLLDILLIHDFPEVSLKVAVTGTLSAPERHISTDPDRGYDDAQLYGFVLGGEPGGDPNAQSREAASAAGASILSAKVGKYLKKVLPIDVLRYETATTSNSQALVLGQWLSTKLFLGFRKHVDSRPDENTGELSIEYYLKQSILLDVTAGDREYDGLDLLWRHRY